ncbi:hypothetical protein D3C84_962170 [compost metagenome]
MKARDRFSGLMNDRAGLMSRPEGYDRSVVDSYEFLKEMDEAMRKAIYRSASHINLAWSTRVFEKMRTMGK